MRTKAGEYEFHGVNVLLSLFVAALFLCLTAHTVLRVGAGEGGVWAIYIEPVIFIATARAFFRSGREYLRERGRAPGVLRVGDQLAEHYQFGALIIGGLLVATYGLAAALTGGGLVYFFIKAKLIVFVVGAFVALNVYLDHQPRTRLVAVRDERRQEGLGQ